LRQLYYLIDRSILGVIRNPRALKVVIATALYQSFLVCSIFYGVGDKELYDIEKEMRFIPTIRYRYKVSEFKRMVTHNLQILRDI